MTTTAELRDCPVLPLDPFSREFLTDPYAAHETMREAGPVVWLERYSLWGMARYAEVHAALNDWKTYSSAAGVGLSDFRKEKPWRPPSIVLEADPPLQTRTHGVLNRVLSRPAVMKLREGFEREAEDLVDTLVERREFDAIRDLAEVYPLRVFPDAVGLPREGRENLVPYAALAFNAFGPRNWLFEQAIANAEPVMAWIMQQCRREVLSKDGFGAHIYAAADAGEVSQEEAGMLVRSLLTAGLDTTMYGIGNAMFCLATFADQWQLLADDPKLAPAAFEETIRFESPVQTFFRTTTRDVEVTGTRLGDGEKVLLFLAAANRDHRKWDDPHRYDIRRRSVGHVGFGSGIHMCVGQMLARLEGEIVLATLAKRVRSIELAGEPKRRLNNTLRGLESLPVRVQPK